MGVSTRSRRRSGNTDRPSGGKADVFPVGLTCLSAWRKNPKGEKRKNNGSFFIIINKNRSAERKSDPIRSVPPFRSQEPFLKYTERCIFTKKLQMHHNLIKHSRIVQRNTSAVSVAAKCRYMPIVMC